MTELLICKCEDCTHWEIGRCDGYHFLICKTCGLEVGVAPILSIEKLNWKEHER